jgi:hypothetical protein
MVTPTSWPKRVASGQCSGCLGTAGRPPAQRSESRYRSGDVGNAISCPPLMADEFEIIARALNSRRVARDVVGAAWLCDRAAAPIRGGARSRGLQGAGPLARSAALYADDNSQAAR